MNGIVSLLLRIALADIAKGIVAALSPTLRAVQAYNLQPADLAAVFGHVATLAKGATPTYGPLAHMAAEDVKDLAEALYGLLKSLLTEYGVALTNDQIGTLLAAVVARVQVKFPAAA